MKFIIILIFIYFINNINGSVIRLLTFNNDQCGGEPYNIITKNICSSKGCFKISPDKKIIYGMSLTSNERIVSGNNIGECIKFDNSSSLIEYQETNNLYSFEGYFDSLKGEYCGFNSSSSQDSNYFYFKKSCNLENGIITLSNCKSCLSGDKNCKIIQTIQTKTQTTCTSIISSKKYTYHNIFDNNSNILNNNFNFLTFLLLLVIISLII
ncbi:hypothetical protein DDB_G0285659 [Dictyostelium discoideum AX4]|uniref:Uncharacterized protein n=1 Tax=Dictyostelium discoideum TaxID=44689 RepID=Q54MU2_DICDI|nr:hypothetical protein DDB_G0285659 [Dictyostelium discoideum AX4]EAL64667.1 hypothetical protein DDB_G0285659 [Dictyostelium discoideum AX4]|eukprot:XP_638201.1 hypothetical protein DDB_G0285659 [Dictyostelium discoideum AX4]